MINTYNNSYTQGRSHIFLTFQFKEEKYKLSFNFSKFGLVGPWNIQFFCKINWFIGIVGVLNEILNFKFWIWKFKNIE